MNGCMKQTGVHTDINKWKSWGGIGYWPNFKVFSPQETLLDKGGKEYLCSKEAGQSHLRTTVNITGDETHGVARPESNSEGTSVKPKLRDILQTAGPLPSKCPGHESQRKTKECPWLKESQETGPLHAAGDPDLDPLQQRTPLGQTVDPEWGLRIRKMLFVLYLQLLCTFCFWIFKIT